jgi:hypothetical protein
MFPSAFGISLLSLTVFPRRYADALARLARGFKFHTSDVFTQLRRSGVKEQANFQSFYRNYIAATPLCSRACEHVTCMAVDNRAPAVMHVIRQINMLTIF